MVQAIIDIPEHTNRVLNIVKAKYGLKDKSRAIERMAEEYEENILEPALRPSYVRKVQRILKQKPIHIGTSAALRQRHG